MNCIDQQPCTDQQLCCRYHCQLDYQVLDVAGGCDIYYTLYDNAESFCKVKCPNPHLDILRTCGALSNEVCTKAQCCYEQCITKTFLPVCSSTFVFVDTHSDYCTRQCNTEAFIECDGGCTAESCYVLGCLATSFTNFLGAKVCGLSATKGQLYDTRALYCIDEFLGL